MSGNELITWLRAQLDTDEAEADADASPPPGYYDAVRVARGVKQLAVVQAHRAILDALESAEARQKVERRNYQRWIDGKPDKPVPDGPREDVIAGLKLAIKFLVSIYSDRDGYRDAWAS